MTSSPLLSSGGGGKKSFFARHEYLTVFLVGLFVSFVMFLPALIMGAAVFGAYELLSVYLSAQSRLNAVILCAGPIAVGVVVYFVCVVVLKSIKKEDCLLLPKGEKIAKLLKL